MIIWIHKVKLSFSILPCGEGCQIILEVSFSFKKLKSDFENSRRILTWPLIITGLFDLSFQNCLFKINFYCVKYLSHL